MGARRDDITGTQRVRIGIEVLSEHRPRGMVSRLAREHRVSRQTIYNMAEAGERVLSEGSEPGPHGPQPAENTIRVDRDRLVRSTVVLTEVGVSQRDVSFCLEEMLDTPLSPSWVNGELAKAEAEAATVNGNGNRRWGKPCLGTGGEIYSNDEPNLLLVGNDSLYIYALTRQPTCDGETWGCVLLDAPESDQLASDAGKGLEAGVKLAEIAMHQVDWDHLWRPLWGQVARLEQQAYAALEAVEERAAKFDQAHTSKRLAQHLAAWERLSAEAEEKIARYDALHAIHCPTGGCSVRLD